MNMLAALEARLKSFWHKLDGEARAELEDLLEQAKQAEQQVAPVIATAGADIKALVATAEPEVKSAVETRLGKLVTDVEALLGTARM
jgi:F0F1-type ATP synthase membrane subunit b/b'